LEGRRAVSYPGNSSARSAASRSGLYGAGCPLLPGNNGASAPEKDMTHWCNLKPFLQKPGTTYHFYVWQG